MSVRSIRKSFFALAACGVMLISMVVIVPNTSTQRRVGQTPEPPARRITQERRGQERPAVAQRVARRTLDDAFAEVARRVPGFGGMFIAHDKTLQIYLLNMDPQIVVAVRAAIIESFGRERIPRGGIRTIKGQYDFLQLKAWHERAREALSVPGVVFSDIDERKNRLRFGLDNMNAQAELQKRLAALSIPPEAVSIELTKPIEFKEGINDKVRPLMGGLQITLGNGSICTVGYLAKRSGVNGFVTCSHCTNIQGGTEGTIYHQSIKSDSANVVGTETADPTYTAGGACPTGRLCRTSDSSFVTISSGVTGKRGEIAHPDPNSGLLFSGSWPGSYQVKGAVQFPLGGEELFKVGRTTGESGGEVDSTCEDVNVNKTNFTLLCQDSVEAKSAKGDSGAPVFGFVGPGTYDVNLYGNLWGGPADGSTFSFSALANTQSELGALDVVKSNEPPSIQITQPANGAKVSYAGFSKTQFAATVSDFEKGANCCTVTWSSNKDGNMGTGTTIDFTFSNAGTRTITATAKDGAGGTDSESITVSTGNNLPTVTIKKPFQGQTFYKGYQYVFEGDSFDSEAFQPLPCNKLKWTSNKVGDSSIGGFPKTGCQPQVTFTTTGARTITLTGTDSDGGSVTDTATINVTDAPANSAPVVTILKPINNAYLEPSTTLMLKGTAKEPGGKSPTSYTYKWVLRQGGFARGQTSTDKIIGVKSANEGIEITLPWKPSNDVQFHCGGSNVRIYLYATDANGKTGLAYVEVKIGYPPC